MNFNDSNALGTGKCAWTISTSSNRNIALGRRYNSNFSIKENDCLLVYDGANSASPILQAYCGTNSSSFQTVYSTGRHLYIELVSNATEAASVFHLRYVTVLNG